ncbi:MAG: membrane protein insertase YidC [Verrucomicrobiota bacterium]|nr:membrane protein insertase YidC [Verrucomicrobiota bacterium]
MDKRSLLFLAAMIAASFLVHFWFADKTPTPPQAIAPQKISPWITSVEVPPTPASLDETFYLLETPYQQLVFSSRGGSLAEINLALKKTNKTSPVREIDIDREILEQSPQNAFFPLYSALGPDNSPVERKQGGYYPLLRRSLIAPDGTFLHRASPSSYALNLVGEGEVPTQAIWKVTQFSSNSIQFQWQGGGRKITKTFSLSEERPGPYCLNLEISVEGEGGRLWLTSGVPDVELVGGSYTPSLRYQIATRSGNEVADIGLPKKGPILATEAVNWLSNSNGYFGLIVDGKMNKTPGYEALFWEGAELPTRLSLIDAVHDRYPVASYPGYELLAALPSSSFTMSYRFFAGPYDNALLKEVDALYANPVAGYNPDYQEAQSIQGWFSFISQPFAQFLFLLMQLFYVVTHSWAAAIILLTIALRAMMYPLNAWSIRSSMKMQEIAPQIRALQERYKKDPRKAQLEVVNLYRQAKVNPFTGCLPMLLQMPFLIGMFYLLKSSFPLRGAPFVPGWIDDLAAPDVLFSWGPPLWWIGNEFHLLPLLMGAAMFLQQRLTASLKKSTEPLSETEKQQKMMANMMSILFTAMFYNFPSGLNLYFMFSTLLGILQQWWMGLSAKKAIKGSKILD